MYLLLEPLQCMCFSQIILVVVVVEVVAVAASIGCSRMPLQQQRSSGPLQTAARWADPPVAEAAVQGPPGKVLRNTVTGITGCTEQLPLVVVEQV